ncbi:hypothetical protein M0813_18445 [Anaeramoeba flamelloides]|uniref:Uncharacterized protein n=1 Tax=Anaeramoeba flamelloides TaxID=1746091 RepID=A0ABQ8YTH2_9EUKA|nr:hypothetical protein M0813_18445 [Anaeramoeba flamelloides]
MNTNGILEIWVTQNENEKVCILASLRPTEGTVRIKKYSFFLSSAKKKTLQTTKKLKREHEIIINTCELQINKIALVQMGLTLQLAVTVEPLSKYGRRSQGSFFGKKKEAIQRL